MTTAPLRILCVDDNEHVGEALRSRLHRSPEFKYVGGLGRADGLVEAVAVTGAQLVLLDMNMPGKDPLEAARELGAAAPWVRVVALSAQLGGEMVDRALEAGLAGYVSKHEEPEVLLASLRRVMAGELVLSPEAARAYAWWTHAAPGRSDRTAMEM